MVKLTGTPMDAPLYRVDTDRGVEYWGCRAVMAAFALSGDLSDLIPTGLHLPESPLGIVFIADYGASTLGPYSEFVSLIQVVDDEGAMGMYIPYIYVTNDSAMAAGREVLGAPKKLADISISKDLDVVTGSLSRPSGTPLATVTVSAVDRLDPELMEMVLPEGTPFYSLRYLPAPLGGVEVNELVRWTNDVAVHEDSFGDPLAFGGPGALDYSSSSRVDPVHRLGVGSMIATVYIEFDLRLRTGQVLRSESRQS